MSCSRRTTYSAIFRSAIIVVSVTSSKRESGPRRSQRAKAEAFGESDIEEVRSREVHRDRSGCPCPPGVRILRRRFEDQLCQRPHQSGFFGKRDESRITGGDPTPVGPPQQGFNRRDLPVRMSYWGWKLSCRVAGQLRFVAALRVECGSARHRPLFRTFRRGGEPLGSVHGYVGAAEQLCTFRACSGQGRFRCSR